MTDFPLLRTFAGQADIGNLPADLIREIQTILRIQVDGIVGAQTRRAFGDFKAAAHLEYPWVLGAGTARALLSLTARDVQEMSPPVPVTPSPLAGKREGKTMIIPPGRTVWEWEYILPNIALTWGEVLNGLDPERRPVNLTIVRNLERTARAFADIRTRYGKPIAVSSGYRPPAVNARVGGARYSQHLSGLALDIFPLDRREMTLLYDIVGRSPLVGGRGDGRRRGFIHFDLRPRLRGQMLTFPY